MASRSRGHKVKSDICKHTILNRIPTASMVKPRLEPLFNEILYDMEFKELPPHKQVVAIMFAKTFCTISDIWDCRHVVKDDEITKKLASMNDLESLTTLLFKCFDKLNTSNLGKEKKREEQKEEAIDFGAELQERLARNDSDDGTTI